MTVLSPKKPPILGTILFALIAISVAFGSTLVGYRLYILARKPIPDFYTKLGDLALELSVVVIVGALIKAVVDWGTSQRRRHDEKIETRLEFMKRVRAMHVAVENSRDLLNAHGTPRTYGEQSRRLMELRPEVEEISEDLKASSDLFEEQRIIVDGLEGIVNYLRQGGEEYVRCHEAVDAGFNPQNARLSFFSTAESKGMEWIRDFMGAGREYRRNYVANLSKAKGTMRSEIYGA